MFKLRAIRSLSDQTQQAFLFSKVWSRGESVVCGWLARTEEQDRITC